MLPLKICSRPRLSLVSWCRACGPSGPIFGVPALVPFIAVPWFPRFPWPSRSSLWAFFVVVCVLGSCSGLTLSRCIPPHFIPHQPHLCLTAAKVHVTSWLSAAEYAAAWRHLSFMEAGVDEKLRSIKQNMAISHQHEIQLV